MVKKWGTEDRGETETCPRCKSVYKVTWLQLPCRDEDRFRCQVCGYLGEKWNDTLVPQHELIERGPEAPQT